jgi:hypothetical protein
MKTKRSITLLIPITAVLAFGTAVYFSSGHNSYGSNASDFSIVVDNHSEELTPNEQSPRMCTPSSFPVKLSIDLLNDPQASGHVAHFELRLTSLIEHDGITVSFILPEGVSKMSGETDWTGLLAPRESISLNTALQIDTEEAISIQAKVDVLIDSITYSTGTAFHIDLGEKEYASLATLSISGYAGAEHLNLIVPKQ